MPSVEILTWVLSGVLEHTWKHSDADGDRRVEPGTLQYLSAGSGIEHAERSASASEPVRVVQMWLAPAEPGGEPRYRVGGDSVGRLGAGGLRGSAGPDRHCGSRLPSCSSAGCRPAQRSTCRRRRTCICSC